MGGGNSKELKQAQDANQEKQNTIRGLETELKSSKEELAQSEREAKANAHDLELKCESLREDLKSEEEAVAQANAATQALRDRLCPSAPSVDSGADTWVADPCKRAVSMGDLIGFFTSHCGILAFADASSKQPICMPHTLARACTEWNHRNRSAIMSGEARMLSPNTHAVDHLVISELTRKDKVSLAELWHRDGLSAEAFVSHWWGQDFGEVCQSIYEVFLNCSSRMHAGLPQHELDLRVRGVPFWMSAFSSNRWNLSRELGDAFSSSLFNAVLESASTKQLVLCVDTSAFVLQRAWCCTEFVLAHNLRKDFLFATRFGSLHHVAAETIPYSLLVSHLALSLESIDIRNAVTSCEQDFVMLTEYAKENSMDEFNRVLRQSFGEVLLPLAARAGDVSAVAVLLEKRASPDACDWRGVHALTHAAVLHGESSNTAQTLLRHGADRRALARASDVMRMFDKEQKTMEKALQSMKSLPTEERAFHAAAIEAAEVEFANTVADSTLFEPTLDDPRRKEEALRCLGRLGDKAAQHISEISLCLFDEHPAIRAAAQDVLIGTGEDITKHVVSHLKDKEPGIRAAAVELLGKSGDAAVPHIGVVAELLDDTEWQVRKAACEALGAVSKHSVAHVNSLAKCLHDAHGDVRTAAVWSLGKFGDLSAPHAAEIADCLSDELLQVRVAAREVLSKTKIGT